MNIYAKKGDKVRFLNENGREAERAYAAEILKEGKAYTIDHTDVYGWHTDVYLQEVPGKSFNSVMFEDAGAKEEAEESCMPIATP
jgi:hypothetical protein